VTRVVAQPVLSLSEAPTDDLIAIAVHLAEADDAGVVNVVSVLEDRFEADPHGREVMGALRVMREHYRLPRRRSRRPASRPRARRRGRRPRGARRRVAATRGDPDPDEPGPHSAPGWRWAQPRRWSA
jgi:hypothetical protein